MADLVFSFDEKKFNKLFPFYLLIDKDSNIISCGKSIRKLFTPKKYGNFFHCFRLIRPKLGPSEFESVSDLDKLVDQLVIISHYNFPDIAIRGQFEEFGHEVYLFVGTPWFDSVEKMGEKNLILNDFAIHDSVIDLLHIIQAKEITNNDIQVLLKSYNEQTKQLKKRETELVDATNRLTELIESLESGVIVEDEDRRIIIANEKFAGMFGIDGGHESLIGDRFTELVMANKNKFRDYDEVYDKFVAFHERNEKKLDHLVEMADGRIIRMDFIPIITGNEFKGHLWKFTDATEEKLLERKLEEQKKFYEHILNEIPADIAVFDSAHRYIFVNPVAIGDAKVREWILGKTDEDYIAFRNKDMSIARSRQYLFDEVVRERRQREWEEKIVRNDGGLEYIIRKMYPVFNAGGQLEMVIGYGVDITERKKIEEMVKQSERRYKNIFDHSLALICVHDIYGCVMDVNNTVLTTLGYEYGELVGSPVSKIIVPKYVEQFNNDYLKKVLASGSEEGIMVARNKDGKTVYLLFQNFLLNQENGEPYIIGFAQNITDRIHAERALKQSEEKYRGIIANMNLGLVELTNNQEIIYTNRSFCEMCGFESTELVGRNIYELFFKNNKENILSGSTKSKVLGDSGAYELKTKNKKGDIKWWLFCEGLTIDENNNSAGSIGVFLDITPQKMLENELTIARYKAETNAKSKEIFLANMSHEIRTPMNAIMGIGKLLQKTKLDTQQKLYLNTIHNAANNLLVILNDLLDFSKIEAGKLTLEKVGFDVRHLVENAFQVLKHKAEEKGLLLEYLVSDGIAPILVGDPYRVNQVLMNLVGNSIKFTESGKVKIEVKVVWEEAKFQVVEFSVIDTGIGMSQDFVAHLFDKFSQEDETVTRRFGGTGLGMSISKQLIELMSGNIRVDSTKNEGTCVQFAVKFERGATKDLPRDENQMLDSRLLKGSSILLVEDNEMNRLLANTLLSQYGALVDEAENGLVATELMRLRGAYDLILMDMQMPVMGGIEATRYIRQNLDANIPIIALTANAFKEQEQECIQCGMNDFISKPFDENKFIRLVARWIGKDVELAGIEEIPEEFGESLYDLSNIEAISRGDKGFIRKMISLFIETMPDTMEKIKSALSENDLHTVSDLGHRMKPSIQNLCIFSIDSEVKSLDNAAKLNLDKHFLLEQVKKIELVLDKVIKEMKLRLPEFE